jgi:hypothetical protein
MDEPKAQYGLDVYRLYEAHPLNLEAPTRTPTNIERTWRQKHGWIPPTEQKKAA